MFSVYKECMRTTYAEYTQVVTTRERESVCIGKKKYTMVFITIQHCGNYLIGINYNCIRSCRDPDLCLLYGRYFSYLALVFEKVLYNSVII